MTKVVKNILMKGVIICYILILGIFWSCKSKEENPRNGPDSMEEVEKQVSDEIDDTQSSEAIDEDKTATWLGEGNHKYNPAQTLYFSHAFIYEYSDGEDKGEFWIYHNPDNGQLLYMPDDPMVEFVVSDTSGNYYFFGNDGHGVQTVDAQFVDWVANPAFYEENVSYPISDRYVTIKPTGKKKSLDESSNIDGKSIIGQEYQWEFSQVSGNQITYITEMIPVNFYQVYGFNKIEGDINLPVLGLDFIGIFGKNQTVTYLESEGLKLELITYQFNPAFVEAGDYEFSVQLSDGTWKRETLPLLSEE